MNICRAGAAIAVFALLLLPSCGGSPVSPSADACAKVVQQVRGAPDRVEVIGSPMQTAEGQVEIGYEYVDGENLPVAGTATCTFAVDGGGSLELVEAIVDGEPLGAAEVAAANRAVSSPGP